MKNGTKFIFIGVLSMLIGSAFASPLLISELDIVPFWAVPEGPKADFSVSVAYANLTLQEPTTRFAVNLGEYNVSILDYYIVLNVTNHSDLPAKVYEFTFAAAKDITVIPSALGGLYATYKGVSGSLGTAVSYAGHVGAGRVEGVWLDGEWINVTWVPEGGLKEIWMSEDIFPPEGLEEIWDPDVYPPANMYPIHNDTTPLVYSYGTRSNQTTSYSRSYECFYIEGGNYWLEGVPLKEYISDNEVKSTLIYYNDSWVDVTGRVEVKERPYFSATNTLLDIRTGFSRYSGRNDSYPSGMSTASSDTGTSITWLRVGLRGGFNNTWAPQQSRLILLTGTLDVSSSWKDNELLKEGEITLCTGAANYLYDPIVDGTYVNTYSSATELKTVQLEITENGYLYNTILADDQMFVTDSFGMEVFIEPRS
jgi:hypothetical protein